MAWLRLFLTLFLLAPVRPGWSAAADAGEASPEYGLKFWRTENGLPQNSITAITQSTDGYIWFGTRNGLVRFDGVRFRVFNAVNTPSLGSSGITALSAGDGGRVWIALADGGLALREKEVVRRAAAMDPEGERSIECLLALDEELWVGTEKGLRTWRGGAEGEWLPIPEELRQISVTALERGAGGIVWVGTGRGLYKCAEHKVEAIAPRDQAIRSLVAGAEGRIWIGGEGFGLLELRAGEKAPRRVWPVNAFAALGRSAAGGLWVVKPGGDVEKLSIQTMSTEPLHVKVEGVTELFEDSEGNLWVGTEGQGLAQLRRKRLVLHPVGKGRGVLSVSEGPRGGLWLAAEGGRVFRLGPEGLKAFPELDEVTGGFCEALCASRTGGLWLGTRLNGVFFWDGANPVKPRQMSPAAGIRAFCEDRQGRIWIASEEKGVLVCEEGQTRQVKGPAGKPFREVTCFAEGQGGRMWIGTRRGLVEWSEHAVRSYQAADSLAGAEIRSLYQDLEGVLWLGTARGLGMLKDARFHAVTSRDGLYDDVIHQILEDFRGQLWLGSNRGIFRVAKDELHDFFAGKITAVQCLPYGSGEGMVNPEGVGARQPTAWRSTDGKLWFATAGGLAGLDPVRQAAADPAPPVIIEEVLLDEGRAERDPETGRKVIPPGYGRMRIRFTALSFVAPERTHFRYRLAGYEEEWRQAGPGRVAAYAQLPAGDYEFQVMARNDDAGWRNSQTRLALTIAPRYWETAWFRILAGLALAGAAGTVWFAHSARARELTSMRQQITRDLHDDMGSNLGSIALLSEALRKGPRAGGARLDELAGEIHRIARETLASMGEAVWFVDPEKDSSADLLAHLKKISGTMLRDIPHRFTAPERPGHFRLALDRKRAVVLIFKEALHNILKHSGATKVEIEILLARNVLSLRVRDNGRGFEPGRHGAGHGLRNMRHRAEKMRAHLSLESAPGQGTELRLRLNCS